MNRWKFLRAYVGKGQVFDKVVFRHVNFDRGDQMVNKLEKFLKQTVGT